MTLLVILYFMKFCVISDRVTVSERPLTLDVLCNIIDDSTQYHCNLSLNMQFGLLCLSKVKRIAFFYYAASKQIKQIIKECNKNFFKVSIFEEDNFKPEENLH